MARDDMNRVLPPPKMVPYQLEDYMQAPSGKGPLASEWADKPHRLVYDLVAHIMYLIELENERKKRNG